MESSMLHLTIKSLNLCLVYVIRLM